MSNNEHNVIIELIKATIKNSDDKFDMLTQRLDENKKEIYSLRILIENSNELAKENQEKFFKDNIVPIQSILQICTQNIKELTDEKKSYQRADLCKVNEGIVKDKFNTLIKRVLYFNIIFLVIYINILYNSNIVIKWENITSIFTSVFQLLI